VKLLGSEQFGKLARGACFTVLFFAVSTASAQSLRFSNHREVSVPEYAVLRIGPFYSSVSLSQSVGYRHTSGEGEGIDFLFENQRGVFLKDGSDFPLVTTLDMRNYIIISRTTDLDISLRASYAHYPNETQEDEFIFDLAEEGITGNISMEFELTPYVKGTVFNDSSYRTDYIDTRGIGDRYGGEGYEHFQNTAGLHLDWLMDRNKNMGLSASRTDSLPSDEKFDSQESVSYLEELIYQQVLNPFVTIGASAAFGQYTYTAVTNRPDTSFQTYMFSTTARLTERTVGAAAIGYSQASSTGGGETDGGPATGGMVGSVSVKTELDRGLDHEIGFVRSRSAGFNSSFELSDRFVYRLNWKSEDMVSAGLFSEYGSVSPSESSLGEYIDWVSGVTASYPLTELIALNASSTYSIRQNKGAEDPSGSELEWMNDYTTWSSQIGTSFAVMKRERNDVVFSTYVQHVERTSDSPLLEYNRIVFVATLTYTHQF